MNEQTSLNSGFHAEPDFKVYNGWILTVGELKKKLAVYNDQDQVRLDFRGKNVCRCAENRGTGRMKAYIGGIHSNDDAGNIIVFAQTSKEAIKLVLQDDISDYRESYIDVYAKRYPKFDNMENLSSKELMKEKWRAGWWFFQDTVPDESESSDQDFYDWYNKTFGLWEGEPK